MSSSDSSQSTTHSLFPHFHPLGAVPDCTRMTIGAPPPALPATQNPPIFPSGQPAALRPQASGAKSLRLRFLPLRGKPNLAVSPSTHRPGRCPRNLALSI
ncbi:hypothetical protein ASPBRDRAFT_44335 [Aspergillus brasiliensis CBS 101740]|uniref:Uncharacterized protein n=1 Tax=Aspergillus brasiliensis (strain CBS 101740 / IMI 381727 / IBT 21946) TaxID=767769 RepID=A0A1L9UIA9_ASPBC|nr:hypothetical protein ASPBRDRAFT_44335 [Aspergillus brasiliensis CBS 101740]